MTNDALPGDRKPVAEGLLSPRFFWTTIGANALIFLGAFESLAVTTVMPVISTELNGQALYSLAFSGTLAASIIGMVVAGGWADRSGPARPLGVAIIVFLLGLILSGTSTDMGIFIVGRFLQGLGTGAINVALYVVVAKIYPSALHPKIFGTFAAAWVLPSMIGPPVAGVVAETFSWHWVFLGVGVLVVVAAGAIVPAMRQLNRVPASLVDTTPSPGKRWHVVWAIIVAAAVLTISLGGESGGALSWVIALVALAVVIFALRPLLPSGALLLRRGLPSTVILRGAIAAAFFGTEVYLPYMLHDAYGLPSWLSGLILTVGAVSWALGSALQSRWGERVAHDVVMRVGTSLLVVGLAVQLLTAFFHLSPFVAAAGWFISGGGMGLIFPRISTLVLSYSSERDQGFNSAAMTIADATGGATAIAFAGLFFAAFGSAASGSFVAALTFTVTLGILALPIAFRVRER